MGKLEGDEEATGGGGRNEKDEQARGSGGMKEGVGGGTAKLVGYRGCNRTSTRLQPPPRRVHGLTRGD